MGSKRDRNTQANLRRGREELVIARQKVASVEERISIVREEARRRIESAERQESHIHARMRDHMGRLEDILNRLYLMQVLSNSQLYEAQRWLDDASRDVNKIDPSEESLFTMFTQQHYTALAEVFKQTRKQITNDATIPPVDIDAQQAGVSRLQQNLMKVLAKDNPKFKDLLFIAAASEHDK